MKNRYFLFLLLISFLSCTSSLKKINGVSFVASKDAINYSHIQPVLNINSNYVALMPFGFIRDIASPEIIYNTDKQWFGEVEKGLIQYAKEFQKQGVHLMVKPQIWVWQGEFTGTIKMDSEQDWVLLEASYTSFILTYARAAQKFNAAILCIGTELEQFVINRPTYWRKLIKKIRTVYKGKLTYAANWDEFKRVPFLTELDYIGIDAYFPLSDKKTPTVNDLEVAWQEHKKSIIEVQRQFHKPILFTEFGYRSVNFSAKNPWETKQVQGAVNLKAQVNALQAIHNQFWKEDWFAGGFVWKWFHETDKVGGINDNRFTPQNKPAHRLLKKLYIN